MGKVEIAALSAALAAACMLGFMAFVVGVR